MDRVRSVVFLGQKFEQAQEPQRLSAKSPGIREPLFPVGFPVTCQIPGPQHAEAKPFAHQFLSRARSTVSNAQGISQANDEVFRFDRRVTFRVGQKRKVPLFWF